MKTDDHALEIICSNVLLNPNKVGLFESSFFWGEGVNLTHLPPPLPPIVIFQEELI